MYGYIMFTLSVMLTVFGGIWIVSSFFNIGKIRCPKCKKIFTSFNKSVKCPHCNERFAKKEGKIFRVIK